MSTPRFGRLMLLAILVVALSALSVMLLGASFVQMGEELGFGPTGLGVLTSLFFLTASAASAPLGRVVERIGWQRAMRWNAVGSAAVLVLIGVAARNVIVLAGLLVMSGVIYGLSNPAANQALAHAVDPRRLALVFGMKHSGIPTATLLAGLAVPLVVLDFGWRVAYVGAAAIAIVVIALVPKGDLRERVARAAGDPRRVVAPMRPSLLVGLAFSSSLATWAAIALGSYLVAYAVSEGFSASAAGWLLFAGSVASLTARTVAGAVTDWVGGRGFGAYAFLTAVGSVVLAAITVAKGPWFAFFVLLAFATAWGWPGLATFTVVNANIARAAASSGISQAGVFVGAGVGPVVLGRIIDLFSFDAAFLTVAVTSALAAVSITIVGRRALAVPVAREAGTS